MTVDFGEFVDSVSTAHGNGTGTDFCGTRTYTITTSPDIDAYLSISGTILTINANSISVTAGTSVATLTGSVKGNYPSSTDGR